MKAPEPTVSQTTGIDLRVRDLGRMSYVDALAIQRSLQQEVIAARPDRNDGQPVVMHLLLVEHDPPVITVSRRQTARQHLVATPAQLEAAGVEVAETDRGGDITYHGPGQLVVYPILDLNALGLRLHGYMRLLEQIVIEVLAAYGIEGQRDDSATGVWVASNAHGSPSVGVEGESEKRVGADTRTFADSGAASGAMASKICALGVRVSRWVSMHGLALNVTTDLSHFQLIVPCGLVGRPVTSMITLLGESCPTMDDVKRMMVSRFRRTVTDSPRRKARNSPRMDTDGRD